MEFTDWTILEGRGVRAGLLLWDMARVHYDEHGVAFARWTAGQPSRRERLLTACKRWRTERLCSSAYLPGLQAVPPPGYEHPSPQRATNGAVLNEGGERRRLSAACGQRQRSPDF